MGLRKLRVRGHKAVSGKVYLKALWLNIRRVDSKNEQLQAIVT
jgi:hypothetical protein